MAKKKTKKSPKNKIKKIDVNKYTPSELINRGVSMKEQRKIYSDYRSIAMKRIKRLQESAYKDVDEAKKILPTLKEIDEHEYPTQYFHFKLIEVINFLNNELSLLTYQEKRVEIKTRKTLAEHGFVQASKSLASFAKFMNAVRARYMGLFYDSDRVARWYENNRNNKMNVEELADAYIEFQRNEDKTIYENMKLLHPKDYKKRLAEMYEKTVTEVEKWIDTL